MRTLHSVYKTFEHETVT